MDWIIAVILALLVLFFVMAILFWRGFSEVKPKPLEGIFCPPFSHPMLGHPSSMIHPQKHEIRRELADSLPHAAHQLLLAAHTSVFVNDPALAATVLRSVSTKGSIYNSHRYEESVPDLFTADGAQYARRRETLSSSLRQLRLPGLPTAFLKDFFAVLEGHASRGEAVDVQKLLTLLGLDMICQAAFDWDLSAVKGSALGEKLYECVTVINYAQASSGLYPLANAKSYSEQEQEAAVATWRAWLNSLKDHVRSQARRYREANGRLDVENSLAHALVALTDLPIPAHQQSEEVRAASDKLLVAEIHHILKHGMETISTLFIWITVVISQNKRVRKKLQREIVKHQPTKACAYPTFLQDVLKETMRMHSPCGNSIVRTPTEDFPLGDGVTIPKNTPVHLHMHSFHNAQSLWNKPRTFSPERWRRSGEFPRCPFLTAHGKNNSLADVDVFDGVGFDENSLAFFPFSAGERMCLGMEFVLKHARLFLKQLVSRFVLEPVEHGLDEDTGISLNAVIVPALPSTTRLRVMRIESLASLVNSRGESGLVAADVRETDYGWASDEEEYDDM